MKSIMQALVFVISIVSSIHGNAAQEVVKTTALDKNWVCTTNASSPSYQKDKDADKNMGTNPKSAINAFGFASRHCRDCTKITCTTK